MAQPVTVILGLGREVGDAVARRFSKFGHHGVAADPSDERIATARNAVPDAVLLHHGELHTRLGLRNALTVAVEAFGRVDNLIVIPDIEAPDSLDDFVQEKFDKAVPRQHAGRPLR